MPTRRSARNRTDAAAANPDVQTLVQRRAAVLYTLSAAIEEIAAAQQAVQDAQKAHDAVVSRALDLQQQAIAQGWAAEDLKQAGLLVSEPRRRRRPSTSSGGAHGRAEAAPATGTMAGEPTREQANEDAGAPTVTSETDDDSAPAASLSAPVPEPGGPDR